MHLDVILLVNENNLHRKSSYIFHDTDNKEFVLRNYLLRGLKLAKFYLF